MISHIVTRKRNNYTGKKLYISGWGRRKSFGTFQFLTVPAKISSKPQGGGGGGVTWPMFGYSGATGRLKP